MHEGAQRHKTQRKVLSRKLEFGHVREGTGRLLVPLLEAGFEVYGVDISENMLAVCRSKVTPHASSRMGDPHWRARLR